MVLRPISTKETISRKQKVSRETDWDDIIAEKLVCKINKFETLIVVLCQ